MAIERIINDGVKPRIELILPQNNILLPRYFLYSPYTEWYLRVEDLDTITLFYFGEEATDSQEILTGDNITRFFEGTRFYKQEDIIETYRWRKSTPTERRNQNLNPPTKTAIPRRSRQPA